MNIARPNLRATIELVQITEAMCSRCLLFGRQAVQRGERTAGVMELPMSLRMEKLATIMAVVC